MTQAGRPRKPLAQPGHPLTGGVRRLIDLAHDGSVRDASRLTGVPYPTLNDLYIGRTVNPNVGTLDSLRAPYGIDLAWLFAGGVGDKAPRTGRLVMLPPHPLADIKRRAIREVWLPFAAWSMYEVFSELEARLTALPATADRPIVGEASGDALPFRLGTFLFQPLLAAEKAGEGDVIPPVGGDAGAEATLRWIVRLRALGDLWLTLLPQLLDARGGAPRPGQGVSAP